MKMLKGNRFNPAGIMLGTCKHRNMSLMNSRPTRSDLWASGRGLCLIKDYICASMCESEKTEIILWWSAVTNRCFPCNRVQHRNLFYFVTSTVGDGLCKNAHQKLHVTVNKRRADQSHGKAHGGG